MQAKRVVGCISVGVLLVLVLAVTGAFADPVTGGTHVGDLVTFNSIHTFDQGQGYWDFTLFNGQGQFEGIGDSYWLSKSLFGDPKPDILGPPPPPPPTTTPEPASVYLLALGAGLIFLGTGRRATQS
jgi:hypothetical protein